MSISVDPADLLKRNEAVLSEHVLKALTEVSTDASKPLSEIVEAIGTEALALIAICQSIALRPEFEFFEDSSKHALAVLDKVRQAAPAMMENEALAKLLTELREAFEASVRGPDGGTDHYPNDEISAVRAVPFFLPVGERFLPLLRVEILSERKSFPTMNLRLSLEDVAFIIAALLNGAVDTLQSSKVLAKHDLLLNEEVAKLLEMAGSVSVGLERLKAANTELTTGARR